MNSTTTTIRASCQQVRAASRGDCAFATRCAACYGGRVVADPHSPPGAQDGPALRPVNRRQQAIAVFLIAGGAWGLLLGLWQSADGRGLQLSLDAIAPFIFFVAAGVMSWRR